LVLPSISLSARDRLELPDVPAEYFLALALGGPFPAGVVHYHASFYVTAEAAG
jgi:predicted N-acetyltransferase YhbS